MSTSPRQRRPRPATPTRRWPARPPTPAQLAAHQAHRQLEQAYRRLHRAEAYAAGLRREQAHTPPETEHARTIQTELKAATAHVARARTRYAQAEQHARSTTPKH